jgi:hypothetical protein
MLISRSTMPHYSSSQQSQLSRDEHLFRLEENTFQVTASSAGILPDAPAAAMTQD